MLPSTAEPEGYTAEKAKGNIKVVPPGGVWACQMWMGYLDPAAAGEMEKRIATVISD